MDLFGKGGQGQKTHAVQRGIRFRKPHHRDVSGRKIQAFGAQELVQHRRIGFPDRTRVIPDQAIRCLEQTEHKVLLEAFQGKGGAGGPEVAQVPLLVRQKGLIQTVQGAERPPGGPSPPAQHRPR